MATGPETDAPAVPGRLATWGLPLAAAALAVLITATGSSLALFREVNGWPAVTGDAPWALLSLLGEGAALLGLSGVLLGRRPRVLLALLLAALLSTVALHALKDLVDAPRPARVLDKGDIHIVGQRLTKNAFPSGHSATIGVAAAVACCALARGAAARAGILLLAALVGLSRLAVGAHWPLDVLGGVALGWLSGCAALHLLRARAAPGRRAQIALGVLTLLAAAWEAVPGGESIGYEPARLALAACGLLLSALGLRRVCRS